MLTNPIRVLALNYEYPPIGGGGGNAHQHILKQFAQFGELDITLITTTPQDETYTEEYGSNVRIQYLPIQKQSLHYWKRGEVIRYLWSHHQFLKQHLKENTYDLCHVFFGFPTGLLAYLHRKQLPYIVSVRGSDVPGYNKRFALDYIILRPLLNRIYRNAKAVVANSQQFAALFDTQFPELKAEVITNGIDTEAFQPLAREPSKTIKIITSARLIPRKGIDVLIKACQQLSKNEIQYELLIAGEGPEEEPLKRLCHKLRVSPYVKFLGRIERNAMQKLLPQCDIFVLPSYAEGMSNAALEALACGLPLILTNTGGTAELIKKNGYIIPAGDDLVLADKLMELCEDSALRLQMGIESRKHAMLFSWQNIAKQYDDLYHQIR